MTGGGVCAERVQVDRASPADLMQLAIHVGPAPMNVGAVLVLGGGPGFNVDDAQRLLGERIGAVPRLRQRLCKAPLGCGRPFWADDRRFDLQDHVKQVVCPSPGNDRALFDVAGTLLGADLPRSRPLWSATFVTGIADGSTGLIIVMNHVLADGIGGLAVLAELVDGPPGLQAESASAAPFPARPPCVRALAADAWKGRARRLAAVAGSVRAFRQGVAEVGGARLPRKLPATSLNRRTGPQRRIDVVVADLAAVRDLGRAHGGTVNDVILAAVGAAVRALLASRGEQFDLLMVSVPVSARQTATGGQLGNQVGVMPVPIPVSGDLATRVTQVAAITRRRKVAVPGSSAALVGPAFRVLAAIGLLPRLLNRQRLVHTFVTNLHGPAEPVAFGGAPVRAVIPIPNTTGNVTVTFGALSYAGQLCITVLSDPSRLPDVPLLTTALREQVDNMAH